MRRQRDQAPRRGSCCLPPETRAWLLGCSPAAPLPASVFSCFQTLQELYSIQPWPLLSLSSLPVSKQALLVNIIEAQAGCLQEEGFDFLLCWSLGPWAQGERGLRGWRRGGPASCSLPLYSILVYDEG